MKKSIALLLAVLMLLTAAPAAFAAKTLRPLPVSLTTDALSLAIVHVKIEAYNEASNELTLTVYEAESFDADALTSLKKGDAIVTDGVSHRVKKIEVDDDYVIINESDDPFDENTLWFNRADEVTFRTAYYDDCIWIPVGTVKCKVPDTMIFLDEIDAADGEMLPAPLVYSATDFLRIWRDEIAMTAEDEPGIGFASHNVEVIFGEDGSLALIRRFYCPWQ